jgi:hypothetical protein
MRLRTPYYFAFASAMSLYLALASMRGWSVFNTFSSGRPKMTPGGPSAFRHK